METFFCSGVKVIANKRVWNWNTNSKFFVLTMPFPPFAKPRRYRFRGAFGNSVLSTGEVDQTAGFLHLLFGKISAWFSSLGRLKKFELRWLRNLIPALFLSFICKYQGTFESIPPSADTGRRSRGLATPIRRGRFEIIKDKNQSSRFATKNAFATIQPAGRR